MSDSLITRLLQKMVEKNRDKLLSETENLMADGYGINIASEAETIEAQDVPEIVANYYCLLKAVYRGKKPKQVQLDPYCHHTLIVDGVGYDIKKGIRWHDRTRQIDGICRKLSSCFKTTFFQRFKVN